MGWRGGLTVMLAAAASFVCTPARADEPEPQPKPEAAPAPPPPPANPPNVWTKFETYASRTEIAKDACSLHARATVDGRERPVDVRVGELACSSVINEGALQMTVTVSYDASTGISTAFVELDVPQDATAAGVEQVKSILQAAAGELQRRVSPPPQAPTAAEQPPYERATQHVRKKKNWEGPTGIGMLAGGYGFSMLVGAAILGASGDPGTWRGWPFIPLFGAVAFSATYTEVPDCNCGLGRAISVIGSVVIDAVQIAGLVLMIVGYSSKTPASHDAITVRLGPGMLEGRF